jgi:hypothetical protein
LDKREVEQRGDCAVPEYEYAIFVGVCGLRKYCVSQVVTYYVSSRTGHGEIDVGIIATPPSPGRQWPRRRGDVEATKHWQQHPTATIINGNDDDDNSSNAL